MTFRFEDKYNRDDGDIGTDYLVPCGGVQITDEAVVPIDAAQIESGVSPLFGPGTTAQKTQVFLTSESMDSSDYVVRGTWAHDDVDAQAEGADLAPSITLLARMSKDPLLFDLGVEESPLCFDQGYGARVTFPLDGTAPILKIVKYQPAKRIPNLTRPSSIEVDGAVVLEERTLDFDSFNLDPDFDAKGYDKANDELPYKGFWQDMRLRIRRQDNEVILEVYLNDRNLNTPAMKHTDTVDPLWGVIGLPGYEFLSATLSSQPSGTSAFSLAGLSVLRIGLFSVETFLDVRRPVRIHPGSFWTYREITNRCILLVEKNGDAKYNATTAAATKFETYLQFVLEAEADIIRRVGYYDWLRRTSEVNLTDGEGQYELPDDMGMLDLVRPGNWNNTPLSEMTTLLFNERLAGVKQTGGRPTVFTRIQDGPNNRAQIQVFPIPQFSSITTVDQSGTPTDPQENPFFVIDYYARQIRPSDPDIQIPFIPQQHIDVLIYGSAAHALLLDTDPNNTSAVGGVYAAKLKGLVRDAHRKGSSRRTIVRSAADVFQPNIVSRIPILRSTQLENLLI